MRHRTIIVLIALVASLEAVGLAQSAVDVSAISDIEQQLAAAWVKGDRTFIEDILAPEWSITDASGNVLTRRQVLDESFGSKERTIVAMTIDDVRVVPFGDAAVATGRTRATGSYKGNTGSVVLRFTDVLIRRNGRWQIVASHASTLAP